MQTGSVTGMHPVTRRTLALVAGATWMLIDVVRAAGPLLSDLFDIGVTVAAGTAVATFLLGGMVAWVATVQGRRRDHGLMLVALAVAIVLMRAAFPFLSDVALILVGLVLAAFAIAFLVLSVRTCVTAANGPIALVGTSVGAMAALIEQAALRTWDAVWRDDAAGWIAIALLGALVIGAAWSARFDATDAAARGWWAYGLHLSLVLYAYGNLAFVTSQTDLRMSAALAIGVTGLAAGALLTLYSARLSRPVVMVIPVIGVTALSAVLFQPGIWAALGLPFAVAASTLFTAMLLRPGTQGTWRFLGAMAAFVLAMLIPFMLVQLDYDIPLGVRHVAVMLAAGALVVVLGVFASWRRHDNTTEPAVGMPVAIVGGVGIVVAIATWATVEQPRAYTEDFLLTPTVMSWNVHYGVTPGLSGGPHVDLDELATTIRSAGADVVLLQEVDRGWILAGGVDILEYLAGELPMEFAYAPAHDPQFGNAVFTSRPFSNAARYDLPYGTGPQGRSAVGVDFMGNRYVSVHLQHKNDSATRVAEIESLLDQLDTSGPVVIGGDFNDVPGSDPILAMSNAGFVSAQDQVGVAEDTYVGADFNDRIDYIWGTNITFTSFDVREEPWSDHLPLVAVTAPTS